MKIFHAIDDPNTVELFYQKTSIRINALISYHYLPGKAYKLTKKLRHMIGMLYLDSGAFSAEKKGVKISISEYRRYIRRYGHLYDAVFMLDDDFENPDHNFINQMFLEEGLPTGAKRPAPVIHDPVDPFGEFEVYAQQGHQLIAIGSNKTPPDDFFEKAKETYPDIELHVFGKLKRDLLMKHKPFSADSSTWALEAAKGSIYYWDPVDEEEHQIYLGEREKTPDNAIHFNEFPHKTQVESMLHEVFDYDYQDLLTDYNAKRNVNFYFFKQLEDYINAH